MSLIHWDPFREMEELMARFPSGMKSHSSNMGFIPAIDMYQEEDNLVVKTPLAGVNIDDVEVSVENGMLTIKGEDKTEHEIDEKNYYRKEIRTGSFFRQIPLPVGVNDEALKAEFEDGVLKITCPKKALPKPKKVPVKVIKKSDNKQ